MIDIIFYLGVGLLLYSWKKNSFDWDKPMFWATIMAWPAILLITFFQAYIEVLNEYDGKKK